MVIRSNIVEFRPITDEYVSSHLPAIRSRVSLLDLKFVLCLVSPELDPVRAVLPISRILQQHHVSLNEQQQQL